MSVLNSLMSVLNFLLRGLFDGLLYPFRGLPALVGLAVVSLVTGIVLLLVFKVTSNQEKLDAVKRRMHAGFFEIRLFNDDLRAILRASGEILLHNVSYLRLLIVPLLWVLVPFVLIVAQLQFHYGYEGLAPGQETLVTVELAEDWDRILPSASRPPAELEVPEGLRAEAGPVWIPSLRELTWRIAVEERGRYELGVKLGDEIYTKVVDASEPIRRRSPRRGRGFMDQLIYPAEEALPAAGPVEAIVMAYPASGVGLLSPTSGWRTEWFWMIVFLVLSIVFAFALRKPFKVTI